MTSEKICPICKGIGCVASSIDENGNERWSLCKCKRDEIESQRLKFAEIPEDFKKIKINDFRINLYSNSNQSIAGRIKKIAINYIKSFDDSEKIEKGFYFYSMMPGSGKTRMAISIGNALYSKYKINVRFSTTIDLLNKIKSTFDQRNENELSKNNLEHLLTDFKQIDCLILDDIGTEKQSSWVEEILYNILNSRMENKKITLFTSNCEVEKLKYMQKLKQRIIKMSVPIAFPEESIRTLLAESENENYLRKLLDTE